MKRVLAFLKRRRARQAGKLHEARRATKHSSPYADLDRNRVQATREAASMRAVAAEGSSGSSP